MLIINENNTYFCKEDRFIVQICYFLNSCNVLSKYKEEI